QRSGAFRARSGVPGLVWSTFQSSFPVRDRASRDRREAGEQGGVAGGWELRQCRSQVPLHDDPNVGMAAGADHPSGVAVASLPADETRAGGAQRPLALLRACIGVIDMSFDAINGA